MSRAFDLRSASKTAALLLVVGFLGIGVPARLAAEVDSKGDGSRWTVRLAKQSAAGAKNENEALLRAVCVSSDCEVELEWRSRLPWSVDFDTAHAWRLSVELAGYWASEETLEPGQQLETRLLAMGRLSGRFRLPQGESLPPDFSISAQSPPSRTDLQEDLERTEISCQALAESFQCEVPAGVLDLRLEVGDFIPFYFWHVDVPRHGEFGLGTLDLERGASLAGWIETEEQAGKNSVCVIELSPQKIGSSGDELERRRFNSLVRRAEASELGFFQIRGLAAGGYSLTAKQPGFAPQRLDGLVVAEGRELLLDAPVVLHRPLTLEIFLDPPVAPDGRPWSVEVLQPQPFSMISLGMAKGEAQPDGSWKHGGLGSGPLTLRISDRQTSVWLERFIELMPGTPPFFLEIPVVRVEGSIRAGDEPFAARLLFGGSRIPQVIIEADEEGLFAGYLPHEGRWPIDLLVASQSLEQSLEPVDVEVRPGRGVALVDIELPNTHLSGVVAEGGKPAPSAALILLRRAEDGKTTRGAILRADDDGAFALHGLPPGSYDVQARKGSAASAWVRVDLREDLEHPSVQLELEEKIEISGVVLSGLGVVPGAEVIALPVGADPSLSFMQSRTTGVDGTFTLKLPNHHRLADLLVVAPGLALAVQRIPLQASAGRPLLLEVESGGGRLILLGNTPLSTLYFGDSAIPTSLLFSALVSSGLLGAAEGGIAVDRMPHGDYRLCEGLDGSTCDEGYLSPGGLLLLQSAAPQSTAQPEGELPAGSQAGAEPASPSRPINLPA